MSDANYVPPTPPTRTGRSTKRNTALAFVVVAGLLAAVLAARTWDATKSDAAATRSAAIDQSKPGLVTYPLSQRVKVPDRSGTSVDGDPVTLRDFAGKIVVVNVWWSWCGPCRAETPDLVRLARQNASKGIAFLGVDNLDSARAFARKFNVPYPSMFDERGASLLPLRGIIPTSVIPSSVVIDARGKVAAHVIGPVTYTTLDGVLNDEIAAGTP